MQLYVIGWRLYIDVRVQREQIEFLGKVWKNRWGSDVGKKFVRERVVEKEMGQMRSGSRKAGCY